jgi:hypothetical protein
LYKTSSGLTEGASEPLNETLKPIPWLAERLESIFSTKWVSISWDENEMSDSVTSIAAEELKARRIIMQAQGTQCHLIWVNGDIVLSLF